MKSFNKYDTFIFLLISSLSLGQIGGALQIPRLLTLLFLPSMLTNKSKCSFYTVKLEYNVVAFIIFAIVSLAWTPDFDTGIKDLIYFIVHFILFFEILVFARFAQNPIMTILQGWVFFIICCSCVSIWELYTDQHLSFSVQDSDLTFNVDGLAMVHRFTSVTFGNYNCYNTVLCFAFPWTLYGIITSHTTSQKLLNITCVLLSIIFILFNASRGALLSFVIDGFIFIIFCPNRKVKYLSVIAIIGFMLFMISQMSDLFLVIGARTASQGSFSEESRFAIWSNALKVYYDTWGLGTGTGGMCVAMDKYSAGGYNITHNLLLEILVQYNVVFTIIFILFLWRLLKKSFRIMDKNRRMLLLMAICSFPAYSIINSGYLQMAPLYEFFACVYVYAYVDLIKCRNEQIRFIY